MHEEERSYQNEGRAKKKKKATEEKAAAAATEIVGQGGGLQVQQPTVIGNRANQVGYTFSKGHKIHWHSIVR